MLGILFAQLCNMQALNEGARVNSKRDLEECTGWHRPPVFDLHYGNCREAYDKAYNEDLLSWYLPIPV